MSELYVIVLLLVMILFSRIIMMYLEIKRTILKTNPMLSKTFMYFILPAAFIFGIYIAVDVSLKQFPHLYGNVFETCFPETYASKKQEAAIVEHKDDLKHAVFLLRGQANTQKDTKIPVIIVKTQEVYCFDKKSYYDFGVPKETICDREYVLGHKNDYNYRLN